MVLDGKPSQEYPVNVGVTQGSILAPTLFLLYINDLPDDVTCDTAIYADDTSLYSKCDQVSDLWQHLELASELECDLRDTVNWGMEWLGVLTLYLLLKLSPIKLELYLVLWDFFLLRLLCISMNLSYAHVWNIIVTSGLVPLVATWNC